MPLEDFLVVPMPAQITVSASPPASKNTSAPAGTVAARRYNIGLYAALCVARVGFIEACSAAAAGRSAPSSTRV